MNTCDAPERREDRLAPRWHDARPDQEQPLAALYRPGLCSENKNPRPGISPAAALLDLLFVTAIVVAADQQRFARPPTTASVLMLLSSGPGQTIDGILLQDPSVLDIDFANSTWRPP